MSPTVVPTSDLSTTKLDVRSALLARNWWVVALRGAVGILFGIIVLMLPAVALYSFALLFAAYLLVDGVLAIGAGVRAVQHGERWGLLILEGVVNLLGAGAAIAMPGLAITVLVYLIAFWSMLSGAFMMVAAFQLHLDHGRWLLVLSGVVSVIFGVALAVAPITGALVLAIWIGAYAIVFGAMLLMLGFRLRSKHMEAPVSTITTGPGPAARA